jgi:hypothetical protein
MTDTADLAKALVLSCDTKEELINKVISLVEQHLGLLDFDKLKEEAKDYAISHT